MPGRVVIVGGGITGLSTAYYLQQAGIPSTLVEREPRLGGVITTEIVDGCVIEGGPDSFLTAKPWALHLIRDLGLESEVIGSNDHLRVTYVRRHGRLVPLPDGLMMMVPTRIFPMLASPLLGWRTKFQMGMDLFRRAGDGAPTDRSVADFVTDHYGEEAVDYLAEPLLAGVYGGTPRQLSVNSVLTRFVELESQYGSLTRGVLAARKKAADASRAQPLFQTLKGGMGRLTGTIERRLAGSLARVCGEAECVEPHDGGYRIRVAGDWIQASRVVLACQGYEAAALCRPLDPALAGLLEAIPYSSSMTVALGYERSGFAHKLNGFGFLVPRKERRRVIACTWVGTKFSHRVPESRLLLRLFLGGAEDPEVLGQSDDAVVETVRDELRDIMGVTETPVFARVSRWPRSMAQYTVGHGARLEAIEDRRRHLPGLYMAGNAYYGIGIPDCVRMGKQVAEAIAAGKPG
jgi:oxygen-dependent protoporphyrinogen oxidase